MPKNWIPLMGSFVFTENLVTFRGETFTSVNPVSNQPEERATVGIALCDSNIKEGEIRAIIRFNTVDINTGCGIIISMEPTSSVCTVVGLGLGYGLIAIRHFNGKEWQDFPANSAGSRINLIPDKDYALQISIQGSMISASVDGIPLIKASNPWDQTNGNAGLYCSSDNNITIRDLTIEQKPMKAFVVMQFSSPYNELYTQVVKPICKEYGIEAERADDFYGPGMIIGDIIRNIQESSIVIAEITPTNCNVYYEVGYAHALNKPTILIADKNVIGNLPFDISPFRVLLYENTIDGKEKVDSSLRRHLDSIMPPEIRQISK